MRVIRVQKGGVVPIRFEFRTVAVDTTDGERRSPNGVILVIENPDGTTQTAAGSLVYDGVGGYIHYWNTASLAAGDYRGRIRYGQAFSSASGGPTQVGERAFILRLAVVS